MASREEREERQAFDHDMFEVVRARAKEEQLAEQRGRDRALSTAIAKEQLFLERFEAVCQKVFKAAPKIKPYVPRKKAPTSRLLNVVESDLHFHSLLDPREVPLQYGPTEEARRLAGVTVQTIEYKRQYREETELNVHLIGDIIQNQLHDPRDGAPLAEQGGAALHLLTQQIGHFAQHFKKVHVKCTPGNHGRFTSRHRERAIHQKWDAFETFIYFALKMACAHMPNVEVELTYRPYYSFTAFDKRGLGTHGDTVIRTGYPGKTIDVASIRGQINEINAAEGKIGEQEYDLVVVGHVHVASMTYLPNGAIFMSNGPLVPSDPHAVSHGQLQTRCGQWLFESVPGHIVGDARLVEVDHTTDKDKALDKVISAFRGF